MTDARKAASNAEVESAALVDGLPEQESVSRAPQAPQGDGVATRREAAAAAATLLRCNGHDLTVWGGEDLLDCTDALRALRSPGAKP